MQTFVPWEKYPGLSPEKLSTVADLLKQGRHLAVLSHEPDKGDNAWTLGCLAYRRTCYLIEQSQAAHDWLRVIPEPQNRFTL